MAELLSLLFVVALLGLILGTISPKLVLRWGEAPKSRRRVLKVYGLACAVLLLLLASTPNEDAGDVPTREGGNVAEPLRTEEVVATEEADAAETISDSEIWYGSILRARFPEGVPLHGVTYDLNELPALPHDITHFEVSTEPIQVAGTRALRVAGSLELSPLPAPFEVFDGTQGERYMLHLQAYVFSPAGRLVWQQQGFPADGAWVEAGGGRVQFTLMDTYPGPLRDHELLVIAAGDPILSSIPETRVLVGAFRRTLE